MTYEYIPKLIRAALNNDRKNVEAIALLMGRKLRREDPGISEEIMRALACVNTGASVMRSIDISPLPVDKETRNQLAKVDEPLKIEAPILQRKTINR